MRVLMKTIFLTGAVLVIAAALLLWFLRPQQPLDLAYTELPLREKALDMLRSRKLEVVLTEAEVNELLKKALAASPQVSGNVRITGARFYLEGEALSADVQLLYRDRWEAAGRLFFDLSWQDPYLTAVHTGTEVRGVRLPDGWFQLQPLQAELNSYLPQAAAIRDLQFEPDGVRVGFRLR
ncbi:hypothetical protein [Paenibacillus mucilaginosus]|uniref:Uncharacterized protein n=3 Tax=Paenibacillus mucilaginosus TaxID=61624 RepID=H6NRW3_9BACL|nr:hypothetical protein [Paenibacillus mucilaginosus]AEI45128.1 hypothetical protein KNP414_06607 [Paenibacillus mucilaginosus KNP414]AFC32849.1 hypothetical protein PM3016_6210 [Paenibacillus mucilaginosus 3016]AFH65182.1 hypothetical protein B2K_31490 [Paenibacillus mucilaginosus K02]MCG7212979.1 hypothetical protein [Paenibacillus mucilaginosus]WDM26609.1 hypothetical protein KCX80_29975 [Paenibacillus mucilaginosus]